jgi:hypothetical protein
VGTRVSACAATTEYPDFSMTRTPERDAQFEWIGALSNRQIYLYKFKSRTDIRIKTLSDAGAYKTGLVREMASAKEFLRKRQFLTTWSITRRQMNPT